MPQLLNKPALVNHPMNLRTDENVKIFVLAYGRPKPKFQWIRLKFIRDVFLIDSILNNVQVLRLTSLI